MASPEPVRCPPGYAPYAVDPSEPLDYQDWWLFLHGDYDEGEGWG